MWWFRSTGYNGYASYTGGNNGYISALTLAGGEVRDDRLLVRTYDTDYEFPL